MFTLKVTATIGLALCLGAATQALAAEVRVALLPIVVHSSDEDSSYVSEGLGDMLAARIERSGEVAVVRVGDRSLSTTNGSDAVAAARNARAEYVLYGSFTQFGDGASLDIRCAPVSSDPEVAEEEPPRRIFIQSGTLQEIIPKLDDLSEKVTRFLASGAPQAPVSPSAPGTGSAESAAEVAPRNEPLDELRSRVDALERAVYTDASQTDPAEGAALAGTP